MPCSSALQHRILRCELGIEATSSRNTDPACRLFGINRQSLRRSARQRGVSGTAPARSGDIRWMTSATLEIPLPGAPVTSTSAPVGRDGIVPASRSAPACGRDAKQSTAPPGRHFPVCALRAAVFQHQRAGFQSTFAAPPADRRPAQGFSRKSNAPCRPSPSPPWECRPRPSAGSPAAPRPVRKAYEQQVKPVTPRHPDVRDDDPVKTSA